MEYLSEIFNGIGGLKTVASGLGLGVLGLLGVVGLMRKAIFEVHDASVKTREFVNKIYKQLEDPKLKEEYQAVYKEWIEAAEHVAKLLRRLGMRGLAKKIETTF